MKLGGKSVDAIMHGRRMILFTGFVVRKQDIRLPNCVVRRNKGRDVSWLTGTL